MVILAVNRGGQSSLHSLRPGRSRLCLSFVGTSFACFELAERRHAWGGGLFAGLCLPRTVSQRRLR
jgi:hypothetical protein